MRYMVMLTMNENGGPPPPALVQAMDEAMGRGVRLGRLIDAGGLMVRPRTRRITLRCGARCSVTDGPFTEAKEVVGGYAVLEVRSHDEAVEQARRMIGSTSILARLGGLGAGTSAQRPARTARRAS